MEKRFFSEKEAAEILQRAAKLQEESGTGTPYSPGVSLDELRRIAVEAGIDPEVLEKAVSTPLTEKQKESLLQITREYERVVEGELDPDNYDVIYEVLKRPGRQYAQQVGRTLQIRAIAAGTQVFINITSKNGRTKINVRPTIFAPFMTTLYPALLGSFLSVLLFSIGGLWMVGVGVALLLSAIAFPLFSWLMKRVNVNSEKLADDLAAAIQEENESMRSRLAAPLPQQDTTSESSQVHVHDSNV